MKQAIVLGATGGMGVAIVNELVSRGIYVTAFARNEDKLYNMHGAKDFITIYRGDVLSFGELNDAVKGNDVIFHAINIPYSQWKRDLPILTSNIIASAKENSTKVIVVDNIYSYGKSPGKKVKETSLKN